MMKSYIEWIIKKRFYIILFIFFITGLFLFQIKNLKIIIDPNTMLPQSHPYVAATNQVEKVFGSKYVVIIGITPKHGDIFQPAILSKVQKITSSLLESPDVVKENLLSLSARKAKNIIGNSEGLEVKPLMSTVPQTEEQLSTLRKAIESNPAYINLIVSNDRRTTAIIAEFKDGPGGFRNMVDIVNPIVEREKDDTVVITVGGIPTYFSLIEIYSQRMAILFPIAVLLIALIHFEAFRTLQGLILPLVTALLAVIWGVGVMGATGIPMDALNATTPILILAVAAGHAVQLLKRYYEEYDLLRTQTDLSLKDANRIAVVNSIVRVGPVMITAGIIAAFGFFSLMIFKITTVRTFGMLTGIGILSALILEMTFTPALRSMLSPPEKNRKNQENESTQVWDRIVNGITEIITRRRWQVYLSMSFLIIGSLYGMSLIINDNSAKSYFSKDLPLQENDRVLNSKLGGTNTLYLMINGPEEDAIKNPKVLRAIDDTQRFLESQQFVGKTISIADFIKKMNQAMHGDDPAFYRIPDNRELISQYLFLYSMSGEPGDFDSYVNYDYKSANITAFLKTDSSAYVQELIGKFNDFASRNFDKDIQIGIGGNVPQAAALTEVMVHDKLLNIVQICAIVFLISTIVFRSLLAGILVLIPLVFAVTISFGLMGISGIPLNIPTSIFAAMAIGIGADYSIYLIFRLREEFMCEQDANTAVQKALKTAGKASLFVASAIAGGYGVLLFSFGFYVHKWLSILIASAMLFSVFSALIMIPALILTFKPKFIFTMNKSSLAQSFGMILMLIAIGISLFSNKAYATDLSADEIMNKNFIASKVMDSTSDASLILTNKSGQERIRKILSTTKLQANGVDNMRMTRFLAPPDIKGTVSLLIEHSVKDDDMWIYLPALKKVRRLVSSNKKDSFVGTDFSYGDVIGHKVKEWKNKLVKEEVVEGQSCYVVESIPVNDAIKSTSGYSKRLSWISKENFILLKGEYWDEAGQILKTVKGSEVKLVDKEKNKWQPMIMEAANLQTGHRTSIRFENFKANQKIRDDFFTTRYMEREQ